jgi:hypothetical protein
MKRKAQSYTGTCPHCGREGTFEGGATAKNWAALIEASGCGRCWRQRRAEARA